MIHVHVTRSDVAVTGTPLFDTAPINMMNMFHVICLMAVLLKGQSEVSYALKNFGIQFLRTF